MPANYSVVQYVPDAVRGEAVNIGVVSFDQDAVESVFLQHWQRVTAFSSQNISFFRELAGEARRWDVATVQRLAQSWTGSVRLTAPQASLLDRHELLTDAAARYLVDIASAQRGYRSRETVVQMLKTEVRQRLVDRLGAYGRLLLRGKDYQVHGRHMAYYFDVSVGNGHPLFAGQGISFEAPSGPKLNREISATAWLVEDVKREYPDLPIGVITLPPKHDQPFYDKALRTLKDVGAEVVPEHELTKWADRMVALVPPAPGG